MISNRLLKKDGEEIYNNGDVAYFIYNRRKYKVDIDSRNVFKNIKLLKGVKYFKELSYLLPKDDLYQHMKEHKASLMMRLGDNRCKINDKWCDRMLKNIRNYGKRKENI